MWAFISNIVTHTDSRTSYLKYITSKCFFCCIIFIVAWKVCKVSTIPCFSSIKNATYKFRLGHITFMAICQVDIECTKLSFILFCRIKFSNSWTNSIFNEHKIHTNIKRFIFKPISHTKPSLCKPCSTHKYTWSRMGQTLPGLSPVPPPTAPNPNPTYTRKSFKKGLPKLSNPTTHT